MKIISEMKIGMANDHAGTDTKKYLMEVLQGMGAEVVNFGTDTNDSCDYPDYAHPLANAVEEGKVDFGIAICGSGNGISMTCNKHKKVRCALSWQVEIAKLARQHNNANIVGIPARFISMDEAKEIVLAFLSTDFEGGRHIRRVEKISEY